MMTMTPIQTKLLSAFVPVQRPFALKKPMLVTEFSQLFQLNTHFAECLHQLRHRQISFLNLGNLILCPEHDCFMVFQHKRLVRIESMYFGSTQFAQS